MSLQTRFIVSVVALILVLVVVILVIIEQRERRALFEGQKSKGILIAKYIAQMNNYALQQWDEYGVQESVDNQIDENLIYVIFYDRSQNPWVSNKSIKAYKDILANSFLSENTGRNDFFFSRRKLKHRQQMRFSESSKLKSLFLPKAHHKNRGRSKLGILWRKCG